jgi:hypothetical protein
MRSLAIVGLLGTFVLGAGLQAQGILEHAAAASGAVIGTAGGKPLSNAITKIFGTVDTDTKKAAVTKPLETKNQITAPAMMPSNPGPDLGPTGSSGGSAPSSSPARTRASQPATAQNRETATVNLSVASVPPVSEPARKEPTLEEVAAVKVGATMQEMVELLGPPESRVVIPDDGHLLEICQYWSKGRQLGTIRVDNGQVITVQTYLQN